MKEGEKEGKRGREGGRKRERKGEGDGNEGEIVPRQEVNDTVRVQSVGEL